MIWLGTDMYRLPAGITVPLNTQYTGIRWCFKKEQKGEEERAMEEGKKEAVEEEEEANGGRRRAGSRGRRWRERKE